MAEALVPSDALAKGEDITASLLAKPRALGPNVGSAHIAVQRAAVISFQTWCFRNPGLFGILVGQTQNKKLVAHSIIVGESFEKLWSDGRVKEVCSLQELVVCGITVPGNGQLESDRQKTLSSLSAILESGQKYALCVYVT